MGGGSDGCTVFAFEHVGVDAPEGSRPLLDDVTLEVPGRGITVLAGPSGSGKSTLLRLCNRLEVPTRGVVRYRGDDVAALDPRQLRREVGMVFQRSTLFDGTVMANLHVADPSLTVEGGVALLSRVGLDPELLDRDGRQLSGGEQQRVCLARTLATRPRVLLMDEPTSALDPDSTHTLEHLARSLAEQGTPIVWVSHDRGQQRRLADWLVVLEAGRVVLSEAATAAGHEHHEEGPFG